MRQVCGPNDTGTPTSQLGKGCRGRRRRFSPLQPQAGGRERARDDRVLLGWPALSRAACAARLTWRRHTPRETGPLRARGPAMANRSPIAPRVAPAPRTTSALASVSPLRQTLTGRPPTGGRRQAKRAGCPITRRRPSLSARQFWAQRARPGVRAASIARDAPPLRARNTASRWPTISALKTKDYGSRPPHPLAGGNAEGDTLSLVRAASLDECDPGAAGLPRSRASTPWWPSLSTLPLQYAHPVPTGPTGSCHVRGAEKEST